MLSTSIGHVSSWQECERMRSIRNTDNTKIRTHRHRTVIKLFSKQDCLSVESIRPACVFNYARMTLTFTRWPWYTNLKPIYCLKMYLHAKNEVSRLRLSKGRALTGETDRHTDIQRETDATECITTPHSAMNAAVVVKRRQNENNHDIT